MVKAESQRDRHLSSVRRLAGALAGLPDDVFLGLVGPMVSSEVPVGKVVENNTISYLFKRRLAAFVDDEEDSE